MLNDFVTGARCALSGFSLVRQQRIRRYALIPFAINSLLFIAALWIAYYYAGQGIDSIMQWLPNWLDWLRWLLWLLAALVAFIVVFYTFTLVANIIGAPFNGLLAEKLEEQLTGSSPPSSGQVHSTLLAIKHSVRSEIGKFVYLLSHAIPLLLLSFIPIINIAAPVLWFVFGAWMLALEYVEYPMSNHGLSFNATRQRAKQRRGLLLGFGSVIMLMTMLPVLNFLAMPVAVVGATQLWVKHLAPYPKPDI